MRILSICYIFVEFSLLHVLRSVPKNYLKQSSLNSLKLKKSSIKWTTFRCHFLNNGLPRFINIKYMVWMDTRNTKGTPHKCSFALTLTACYMIDACYICSCLSGTSKGIRVDPIFEPFCSFQPRSQVYILG